MRWDDDALIPGRVSGLGTQTQPHASWQTKLDVATLQRRARGLHTAECAKSSWTTCCTFGMSTPRATRSVHTRTRLNISMVRAGHSTDCLHLRCPRKANEHHVENSDDGSGLKSVGRTLFLP
eukprot:1348338-Rhodomonas_salina.1